MAIFRNILSLDGCLRLVTVAVVFGMLAACSSAADTTRTVVKNLNPVNWFDDDEEDKDEDEDEDDLSGAVSGSQMETIKLKSSLRAAAASFLRSAAISP